MKEHSFYLKDDRTLIGDSLLGVAGENLSDKIKVSVPLLWGEYQLENADFSLAFHNSENYFCEIAPSSVIVGERIEVTFPVTREMCAVAGEVKIQLNVNLLGEVVLKSQYAKMSVSESAIGDADISSEFPTQLIQMQNDIDGKADKTQLEALKESKADKTELDSAVSKLANKADKVPEHVGSIAGLDENGNLCDSTYSIEQSENGYRLLKNGEEIFAFGTEPVTTFSDIQSLVRSGQAEENFEVGDIITCQKGGKEISWEVIGIDHDRPTDSQYTHSMTLMLKDIFVPMKADVKQALYITQTPYSAGSFIFFNDANGFYAFTPTVDIPVGAHIVLNENLASVTIYSDQSQNSVIEVCDIFDTSPEELPEEYEYLSTTNEYNYSIYGKCDYLTSPLRLWLNSSDSAWWSPTDTYSREYNSDLAGFLSDIEGDFLSVLGNVNKKILKPDNTIVQTSEKFFILSKSEVDPYASQADGFCYFAFTDEEIRKRSYNGAFMSWRLRTPRVDYKDAFLNVGADGNFGYSAPNSQDGVIPACCIV